MARIHIKPFLPHIALALVAIFLLGGLFVLVKSEQAKTRDTLRMQDVLTIRSALRLYYINHASYPASPEPIQVGDTDHSCLSDSGFVAQSADSCVKRSYQRTLPASTYIALADNATDQCTSHTACPNFALQFDLETDLFAAKGKHFLTPQGLR